MTLQDTFTIPNDNNGRILMGQQTHTYPPHEEPPVAFAGVVCFKLRPPASVRQDRHASGVVVTLVVGSVDPVTLVGNHDHGVRAGPAECLL